MIIAFNARTLKKIPHDGIGWFTFETAKGIVSAHPEHEFIFMCDRKYDEEPVSGPNVRYVYLPPRTCHPFLWLIWHEYILTLALKKHRVDILVSPDGIIPLRSSVPSLPVIHDLNHVHRPSDIPFFTRQFLLRRFPRYASHGARVATVSHFSARDIAETYGIDRDRIDVVYNGASDIFTPPGEDEAEMTRKEYTGGKPYFLFVGNFSPRKNVETLITSYTLFREKTGSNHLLLLAGSRLYLTGELNRLYRASPYREDIIFTGSVTRSVLRRLYGAAVALTFVPWFEGFGIPLVEAQRCGTPCILSDTSSLPEVSGGAALCCGPAEAEAIAEAMARLAGDEALRRQLSLQGIANSQRFTWENASKQLWESISGILNSDQ